MLVLREYVERELVEEKEIEIEGKRSITIGRSTSADITIGQNFHPIVQRSISRIQATLTQDNAGEVTIVDGGEELSTSGVWYKNHRIEDLLTIEEDSPVVVFQWRKGKEKIQGWNEVRIELVLLRSSYREPPTSPGEWQEISSKIEELTAVVRVIQSNQEEDRVRLEASEREIGQYRQETATQIAVFQKQFEIKDRVDREQTIANSRNTKRILIVTYGTAALLVFSVLLTSAKGMKESDQNAVLDKIRLAGSVIIAGAVFLKTLPRKQV